MPAAPPHNVSGFNISKHDIRVFWEEVPSRDVNGILLGYRVIFNETSDDIFSESVEFPRMNVTLSFLRVLAYTIKGDGPKSPPITIRTEEEGETDKGGKGIFVSYFQYLTGFRTAEKLMQLCISSTSNFYLLSMNYVETISFFLHPFCSTAPQVHPWNVTGHNSSSIYLQGSAIPPELVAGLLREYRIAYDELNDRNESVKRHLLRLPVDQLSVNLTNLEKYTNYSFELQGMSKFFGVSSPLIFCLHYSTGTHKTTMFIYGRVGQPSHRAVYLTYMQICTNIKYYL